MHYVCFLICVCESTHECVSVRALLVCVHVCLGLLLRTVHTSTNCVFSLLQWLEPGEHAIKEELQDFNWFKDMLHTTLYFLSRVYLAVCKTEQWIRQ